MSDTKDVNRLFPRRVIDPSAPAYFVIDGPDGIGKTTWIKKFRQYLELTGIKVILIREPGQTPVGQKIRAMVFAGATVDEAIDLFIADRVITQQLVTKPMLKKGFVVLSDRSLMSSCVYQGFMNDRFSEIIQRHREIADFLWPSMVFVPTLPTEEAVKRITERVKGPGQENDNHLEKLSMDNHEKFQRIYNEAGGWAPFPIHSVDLIQPDDVSMKEALLAIKPILSKLHTSQGNLSK